MDNLTMKLNKKYLLVVFTALVIQVITGVNLVNAACEKESRDACGSSNNSDICYANTQSASENRIKESLKSNTRQEIIRDINDYTSLIRSGNSDPEDIETYMLYVCAFKEALRRLDSPNRADSSQQSSSNNSTSNQSESSSSRQANNNANRQAANNQASSSSNSSDLRNKSRDQLIDISKNAEDRGDYAKAYAAELQLSKDSDPEIARQALRRVAFRLREGQGVKQNLTEAHRLLEKAASMGDVPAHSLLCIGYMDGIGVPENHQKAIEYCLFAADRGLSGAQTNLAWLYSNGNGIQQSQKSSDAWMCKAAAQGEEAAVGNVKKLNINCN